MTTCLRLGALVLAAAFGVLGTPGLGHQVAQAQINDSPPAMFALIITTGLLGILINFVTRFIANRVLFWHASVRGEVRA